MNATADAARLRPAILPPWLRGLLPAWLKPAVRDGLCRAMDAWDFASGDRDPLLPPARLRVRVGCFASYIRRDRYREVGAEFAGHLRRLLDLGPESRLLDIGCGCGQMAAALAGTIGPGGRYEGFDPDAEAIAWCRQAITPRHPWMRFSHADLANTLYNPAGGLRAEDFRFPYEDGAFDQVLLKSIFTHLLPRPLRHYLHEIGRLLAPGGRCLLTGYFPDDEARALMAAGRSAYTFHRHDEDCWIVDPGTPDYVTAHDEAALREAVAEAGLAIEEPVRHGAWSGRAAFESWQDLVILAIAPPR